MPVFRKACHWAKMMMSKRRTYVVAGIVALGIVGVISWGFIPWFRDLPIVDTFDVFHGVRYQRQVRSRPRPLVIHHVEIDLHAPGIHFLVTPGDPTEGREIRARTTSNFLQTFGLQIAINGGFFEPFWVGKLWWQYYPQQGDPVDISGIAISDGHRYSGDEGEGEPALCITSHAAEIYEAGCPSDTEQGLAGDLLLVKHHTPLEQEPYEETLHPRTAVALNAARTILWLIVVDGRQPGISEGVTLRELAHICHEFGVDIALNLDGGGSSTLVMAIQGEVRLINTPIHRRIPRFERPVGNHLGVYAESIVEKPNISEERCDASSR